MKKFSELSQFLTEFFFGEESSFPLVLAWILGFLLVVAVAVQIYVLLFK